jgi:protein-disulfide isomerase
LAASSASCGRGYALSGPTSARSPVGVALVEEDDMAKWVSSNVLEVAATGAVLVAAITVIFRGGHLTNNDDSWSAIDPVQIAIAASPSLGDSQATHAVMMFSDFECPFCRVAADQLIPWLRSAYVDRGQLRLVFKHFPLDRLHRNARRLARLSACASLKKDPWDVHMLLYQAPPNSSVTAESLSKSLDLDAQKLDQCAARLGREIVEQDIADASKLAVSSTPTFVIGTVKNEVMEARLRLSGVVAQRVFAKALRQLPRVR